MLKAGHFFILLTFLLVINSGFVSAQLDLPPGILAIKEYNQQYALEFIQTVTIPLVFLAGVISIISPCILPLMPAFFSFTFKEKRAITKMTLVFFFGFSMIFVMMGIAAAYVGLSILSFQQSISSAVIIAGLGLLFFGILSFFGKGFSSFIKRNVKTGTDTGGVFMMGIFFAVGWSACLGPIIAGILLVVAVIGNVTYGAMLLFVYSLGIMAPLFVISIFYDRFNIGNNKWLKGKTVNFNLLGKSVTTHTTEMISGILLMSLGLIFILFQGTNVINLNVPIGSSILFNELQRSLMQSPIIASVIGLLILILMLVGIILVVFKRKRRLHGNLLFKNRFS